MSLIPCKYLSHTHGDVTCQKRGGTSFRLIPLHVYSWDADGVPNGCLRSGYTCPHFTAITTYKLDRSKPAIQAVLTRSSISRTCKSSWRRRTLYSVGRCRGFGFDSGFRTTRRSGSWRHSPTNRRLPEWIDSPKPFYPFLPLWLPLSLSLVFASLHVPHRAQGWHVRSILRWAPTSGLRPHPQHSVMVTSCRGRDDSQAVDDVGEPLGSRGDGQVGKAFCGALGLMCA